MAEAVIIAGVALGAACPAALVAMKKLLRGDHYLPKVKKKEALRDLKALETKCEYAESFLSGLSERREHREPRKELQTKLEEIGVYLKENMRVMDLLRKSGGKRHYENTVTCVTDDCAKLSATLERLRAELAVAEILSRAWLDRSNRAEEGGIQYSESWQRFGNDETLQWKMCPDSRLDALAVKLFAQAVASQKNKADAEPSILFAHGQPSVGKSRLCFSLLEMASDSGHRDLFPGGCIYLPMQNAELTEEQFAENICDYLEKCMPRHCTGYIPPSRGGPTQLRDVVDFFKPAVRSRRCLFFLDDYWPRLLNGTGARWKSDPLSQVMKLSSSDSIFLVGTSDRMAISFHNRPTAVRFDIPTAERSLMESLFCEGWNSEAQAAGESTVSCIDKLTCEWPIAVRKVLDACGGLPTAAIAAGGALLQRKVAGSCCTTRRRILSALEGGVSGALNGRLGLPDALQTNLDRTLKFCKGSIASTHQFSLTLYRLIGSLKPRWTRSPIPKWPKSTVDSQKLVDFVIAISLSDLTTKYAHCVWQAADEEGDTDEVLRGILELGKYLPIAASKESGCVVMCPLVFDHARSLFNGQKVKPPRFQPHANKTCPPCLTPAPPAPTTVVVPTSCIIAPYNNMPGNPELALILRRLESGGECGDVNASFELDRRGWPEECLSWHSTTSELLRLELLVRQTLGLCMSADCSSKLELELRQKGESLRDDISAKVGQEEWRDLLRVGVRVRRWTEKVVAVRKAA